MSVKYYSPKEVEIRVIDGNRQAFLKAPPDPMQVLEKRVKSLEKELDECREYWYGQWQNWRQSEKNV
jgi:hypothetical protein